MVKRNKRLKSAIESIKAEIEEHFEKLDLDISNKKEELARYHVKEIDKSLISTLEHKIKLLGAGAKYSDLIKRYKTRLREYKKKLGIE